MALEALRDKTREEWERALRWRDGAQERDLSAWIVWMGFTHPVKALETMATDPNVADTAMRLIRLALAELEIRHMERKL